MQNPKIILRILQIITSITAIGLLILTLSLFDVLPFASILKSGPETATKKKVPRHKKLETLTESQSYLKLGDEAFAASDFVLALSHFQKASEMDPKASKPYEKIGDLYLNQKNYVATRQNFELSRTLDPQNSAISHKLGRTFLGLRKVIEAKIEFEKILPETQESLYYQGLIAAFLNEPERAKEFLTQSLSIGGDESLRTNAQSILTGYREFEVARDSKIEFLQAMLAQIFDRVGEYGLAIELSFNAIKKQPDYRDAWIVLGHAFLNEGKTQDAQDALSKAIELDAVHPAAYFYRGLARKALLKTDAALQDFESALKFGFKPQIFAKLELADAYFAKKNFTAAYLLYRDIVFTDPSQIDRFIRPMALAINHLEKPLDALELAKKAFEAHPNKAEAYNLMGWALLAQNDLEGARQNLAEAIKLDPDLAAAYLNLGMLSETEGNRGQAEIYYKEAIELSEKRSDTAIKDTAQKKFEKLQSGSAAAPTEILRPQFPILEPKNVPQIQYIPSLSLQ